MAGRPAEYTSAEQIQAKITEYFEWIKGEQETLADGKGELQVKWKRFPEPATITGLTLFLGFESRQSFYDYSERGEFSYTLKRARTMIECEYEKALSGQMCTGSIFALKNMGWKDHSRTELTGADGKSIVTETHVKIIRDKASGITPGDFTPQPTGGTESEEKV